MTLQRNIGEVLEYQEKLGRTCQNRDIFAKNNKEIIDFKIVITVRISRLININSGRCFGFTIHRDSQSLHQLHAGGNLAASNIRNLNVPVTKSI